MVEYEFRNMLDEFDQKHLTLFQAVKQIKLQMDALEEYDPETKALTAEEITRKLLKGDEIHTINGSYQIIR